MLESGARPPGRWKAVLVLIGALLTAAPSAAQNLYVEGHFGLSEALGVLEPELQVFGTPITSDAQDQDRSVVGGGSFGLRSPLTWILDRDLPRRFPDVHIRSETEVAAGRQFNFFSNHGVQGSSFRTRVDVLTQTFNGWIEIPVYRKWSVSAGVGIGYSMLEVTGQQPAALADGKEEEFVFAWMTGLNVEYRFDDSVTMGVGYRYADPGEMKVNLDSAVGLGGIGEYNVDLSAHEVVLRFRVDFYSFGRRSSF